MSVRKLKNNECPEIYDTQVEMIKYNPNMIYQNTAESISEVVRNEEVLKRLQKVF